MHKPIRIGTRDSALALWQARHVQNLLRNIDLESVLVPIKSSGDLNLSQPLYAMGITGVFTKELDIALLNNQIDLAVHSMKDVPTQLPKGLVESFVPERGTATDVIVMKSHSLKNDKNVIATSSLRRQAQWLNRYPNDTVAPLRGNVQTRLNKLNNHEWDAAIFARAGLERLKINPKNTLDLDWMIPAPAQGAVMVVARSHDAQMTDGLRKLNHTPTTICVEAERDFLKTLQGGCSAPIGAWAQIVNNKIHFKGSLTGLDGKDHFIIDEFYEKDTENVGVKAAESLLEKDGVTVLLNKIKE
jgi:hydroxymethylbilane synthase